MQIVPAILTDDIKDFEKKLAEASEFSDMVHIDVMDGVFVMSSSIKLSDIVEVVSRPDIDTRIDIRSRYIVHLMVQEPAKELQNILAIRPEYTIIHLEADGVIPVLRAIKNAGLKVGLAINPETGVEKIRELIEIPSLPIDLVLILSVNPGYYGSQFIPETLGKIEQIRAINDKIKVGIDGGVDLSSIREIAEAKPDYVMSGSYIFERGGTSRAKYEELVKHCAECNRNNQ